MQIVKSNIEKRIARLIENIDRSETTIEVEEDKLDGEKHYLEKCKNEKDEWEQVLKLIEGSNE